MIGYEQSIVKKIPFLLEIDEQRQALRFAINSGDPNIIDKVFSDILKKAKAKGPEGTVKVIERVNQIEDAMRHLRNYAKKRKNNSLLQQMVQYQLQRQAQLA